MTRSKFDLVNKKFKIVSILRPRSNLEKRRLNENLNNLNVRFQMKDRKNRFYFTIIILKKVTSREYFSSNVGQNRQKIKRSKKLPYTSWVL